MVISKMPVDICRIDTTL